jgi:hypothetical protein
LLAAGNHAPFIGVFKAMQAVRGLCCCCCLPLRRRHRRRRRRRRRRRQDVFQNYYDALLPTIFWIYLLQLFTPKI